MTAAPIHVRTESAAASQLGFITLNSPETLNSLNLKMVDLLQAALDDWRDDPAVAAVLIDGSGDKAFCAGGDLKMLLRTSRRRHPARSRPGAAAISVCGFRAFRRGASPCWTGPVCHLCVPSSQNSFEHIAQTPTQGSRDWR